MKHVFVVALLIGWSSLTYSQYQENTRAWRIVPEILVVHYLPGNEFGTNSYWLDNSSVAGPKYQYSGFGGEVAIRFMSLRVPGVALTLSGGAVSYYKPSSGYVVADAPVPTVGFGRTAASTLAGNESLGDFFAFPLSIGVQGLWPFEGFDKFRVFAGIEASGYFIDGNVAPHAQTRFGYSAIGGFGVGIVDLGVRYSQFADMRNIGVYFGLCLKSYDF